jgi:two-component system, OmpR family, phosphate regulon response regulator OmpR
MKEPSHILIVDDDDRIRDLVRRFLHKEGHRVTVARDAPAARRMLATFDFDLIVLDIMMPGEDGLSLLQSLRERRSTPVILLTARGDSVDRIEGLKAGADDYLPKPFDPEELALRVGAILRRQPDRLEIGPVTLSGYAFHPQRNELSDGAEKIRLTEAETQLLSILASRQGEPVSRAELADLTSAGADRSIDVQVTRLRRKIEPDPKEPVHLQTVRGVGYRLVAD